MPLTQTDSILEIMNEEDESNQMESDDENIENDSQF